MGAYEFENDIEKNERITNVNTAFEAATENARWQHGHSGYTGTIAEKSSFVLRNNGKPVEEKDLRGFLNEDFYRSDEPHDKWGPAWAVPVAKDGEITGWVFYGTASS